MKYDLNKDLVNETKVELEWHGEDTAVKIGNDDVKTPVAKGDIIAVSVRQAKELLSYSSNWTFAGDKPLVHAYDTIAKVRAYATASDEVNLDEMSKPEIVEALKKLGKTVNDRASKASLVSLLKEAMTETEVIDTVDEETKDEESVETDDETVIDAE